MRESLLTNTRAHRLNSSLVLSLNSTCSASCSILKIPQPRSGRSSSEYQEDVEILYDLSQKAETMVENKKTPCRHPERNVSCKAGMLSSLYCAAFIPASLQKSATDKFDSSAASSILFCGQGIKKILFPVLTQRKRKGPPSSQSTPLFDCRRLGNNGRRHRVDSFQAVYKYVL